MLRSTASSRRAPVTGVTSGLRLYASTDRLNATGSSRGMTPSWKYRRAGASASTACRIAATTPSAMASQRAAAKPGPAAA